MRFPWPPGELPTEQQARDFVGAVGLYTVDDCTAFVRSQPLGLVPGWRIALVATLVACPPPAWSREPGDDDDEEKWPTLGKVLSALQERRERVALGRPLTAKLEAFLAEIDAGPDLVEEVDVDGEDVELPTLEALRLADEVNPLPGLQEEWRGWLADRWEIEQEGKAIKVRIAQEQERLRLLRRHGHNDDAAKSERRLQLLDGELNVTRSRWAFYNRRALAVEAEIKAARQEKQR